MSHKRKEKALQEEQHFEEDEDVDSASCDDSSTEEEVEEENVQIVVGEVVLDESAFPEDVSHRPKLYKDNLRRIASSPAHLLGFQRQRMRSNAKGNYVTTKFGDALREIPPFVIVGFEYLRQHSMHLEGLFRVQGSHSELELLRAKLDSGQVVNFAECRNPHSPPSLVKMYFRELPVPLCTYECYDMFVMTENIPLPEAKLDCLKKVLSFIPDTNRELLKRLCLFLKEVASMSSVNKMTAKNLAIVFSPNLLRPEETPTVASNVNPHELMAELQAAQNIICKFIEEAEFFFLSSCKTYSAFLQAKNAPPTPEDTSVEEEDEQQQVDGEQQTDEKQEEEDGVTSAATASSSPPVTGEMIDTESLINEIKGETAADVTLAVENVAARMSMCYSMSLSNNNNSNETTDDTDAQQTEIDQPFTHGEEEEMNLGSPTIDFSSDAERLSFSETDICATNSSVLPT